MAAMTVLTWPEIERLRGSGAALPGLSGKGGAVTVGSFDGPHRGHGVLFRAVTEAAADFGYVPGIVTFRRPLAGLKSRGRYAGDLASLPQRLANYENAGFVFAVVIDFSREFSRMSGNDFLSILVEVCEMKLIAEGRDFRFGYRGASGMTDLMNYAAENHFAAVFPGAELYRNRRISSSAVRDSVLSGDFVSARCMLGRPYAIDCSELPRTVSENAFVFRRDSIRQVVPPENVYDVFAVMPDKKIRMRLEVGSQTLRLWAPSDNADPRIRAVEFID